jgi:hypothetical protein
MQRRGAVVEATSEGRSRNHLAVVAPNGRRSVVYVKTRSMGDWQTDTRKGTPRPLAEDESRFWLFVDLTVEPPAYYIVPQSWIERDIYEKHEQFLARRGGARPRNPRSTHHGIATDRVSDWRDRWDLLGLT